jgi:hypothetical protein
MFASLVATLTRWFAPWQSAYSDSKLLETTVTSVHIVATLVGGGIALAADRVTLLTLRNEDRLGRKALDDLHDTHRPVIIGLAALFLSGVALAAADVGTFAKSPVFLIKLLCVFLLCINGAFLARTEHCLRRRVLGEECHPLSPASTSRLWSRLRTASWLSIFLWITTVVVGCALLNS